MSAAQTAYSGQKLAQFLGITERAVQIRAKRENWQSAPRPGRGGGNLWLLTSMPEKTRLAIAAAVVAQMAKEAERPSKTQAVNTLSKLTPSKQDRAEARAMAVQMARRFAEQSGQSRTVAYEVFAWRYNSGELLSVPLWVRETLPQLCRASLCSPREDNGVIGSFVQNTAEQLPIQLEIYKNTALGYGWGAGIGAAVGTYAGGAGGTILAPVAGTLAGAAGGGLAGSVAGAKIGGVGYAAMAGYNLEADSAYGDFLKAGLDDNTANWASRAYGVLAGAIEGGTELVAGIPVLFGADPKRAATAGTVATKMTIKRAVLGFAKNFGKMQVAESGEEGVQTFTQNLVGEVAKATSSMETDFSFDNLSQDVVDSVFKTLWSGIGAGHAGPRLAIDVYSAKTGGGAAYLRDQVIAAGHENEQAVLTDLTSLSQDSKLAQRDPLLYEDAMRTLAQGGKINSVYIPASGMASGGT